MVRSIKDIAADVRAHWRPVHGSAEEYVAAMEKLDKVTHRYGADTAVAVLTYFLGALQHGKVRTLSGSRTRSRPFLKVEATLSILKRLVLLSTPQSPCSMIEPTRAKGEEVGVGNQGLLHDRLSGAAILISLGSAIFSYWQYGLNRDRDIREQKKAAETPPKSWRAAIQ